MKIIIALAVAALAVTSSSVATAQKFGGYHASAPTYHAPAPVYRAPAPVYRAPAPVYRAPAPVYRQATPTVTYRQPATVARPVPRVTPPRPAPIHVTTVDSRRAPISLVKPSSTPSRNANSSGRVPTRAVYRYGNRNYVWQTPSMMPIWWMAAMHRTYSESAYDQVVRRCIQTPPERRSRECVRALRERGLY